MVGKKEKKRWIEVVEFFKELEIEPDLWSLAEEPLRRFSEGAELVTNEEVAVREQTDAAEPDSVDEESWAPPAPTVTEDEKPLEDLVAGVADTPIAELVAESVSSLAAHLSGESVTLLDRGLPASSFFSQVDWSGNGETKAGAAPAAVTQLHSTSQRSVSQAEPASYYFSSLPWSGETVFEPARLHSPRGLGRLMETATQQALRTAQARGSNVVPFAAASTARTYFSAIQWQQAAN